MAAQHKILIVDDDHDIHSFIRDLLEMYGYAADCVHRTDHAYTLIQHELPDFLILDLHIERPYAGWALLQQLRANPATATIPAVLATADPDFMDGQRDAVRAQGAEVLAKPYAPEKLIELVEGRLGSG